MSNYQTDDFIKRLVAKYAIAYNKNDKLVEVINYEYLQILKNMFSLKLSKSCQKSFMQIIDRDELKTHVDKIADDIQKNITDITWKPSLLDKKFKIVANIYKLDSIDYEILVFLTMCSISSLISPFGYRNDKFENFAVDILKIPEWSVDSRKNSLIKKGIFLPRYDNSNPKVKPQILEVLGNPEIKTEYQIKRVLLGKNQKSELAWQDFNHLEKEREIAINILSSAIKNKTKGVNILLYGSVGTGKTQLAMLIANKAKVEQYLVGNHINGRDASREDRISDLASKQTLLANAGNACILFDEAEDVMNRGFSEYGKASKAYLNQLLEETPVPVFWTTNNISDVDPAFLRRMTYTIEFEKLSEDIRLNIWKRTVRKNKLKVNNKKLIELNKKYEIAPSLIANAVKTTKLVNGTQDDFEVFVENLARVVTKKKNVKKRKEFEMKDYDCNLINSDFNMEDLTQKIKSSGKLNFSLCLYGEPGTGKSLYARYLASVLGIEVILKRASDLISKYVGETEQNIAEAFAEARAKGAMLIFDEADSFLQNRNNALKSWEVSQVNEMLTWMESHDYPFVCTTNLMESLDEASLRRFTFKIKFDFMTKEQANYAFEEFFGIKNANLNLIGLTAGDFATVKKKAEFLGITDIQELTKMLKDEVKVKQAKELKACIGF